MPVSDMDSVSGFTSHCSTCRAAGLGGGDASGLDPKKEPQMDTDEREFEGSNSVDWCPFAVKRN